MLDLDIPPVVEGEDDGDVAAVNRIALGALAVVTVNRSAEFTQRRWTTATGLL